MNTRVGATLQEESRAEEERPRGTKRHVHVQSKAQVTNVPFRSHVQDDFVDDPPHARREPRSDVDLNRNVRATRRATTRSRHENVVGTPPAIATCTLERRGGASPGRLLPRRRDADDVTDHANVLCARRSSIALSRRSASQTKSTEGRPMDANPRGSVPPRAFDTGTNARRMDIDARTCANPSHPWMCCGMLQRRHCSWNSSTLQKLLSGTNKPTGTKISHWNKSGAPYFYFEHLIGQFCTETPEASHILRGKDQRTEIPNAGEIKRDSRHCLDRSRLYPSLLPPLRSLPSSSLATKAESKSVVFLTLFSLWCSPGHPVELP